MARCPFGHCMVPASLLYTYSSSWLFPLLNEAEAKVALLVAGSSEYDF